MRMIFVQPAVGRKSGGETYPKTWIMEPLWVATIAALLPRDCERVLMDVMYDLPEQSGASSVTLRASDVTGETAPEIVSAPVVVLDLPEIASQESGSVA